MVTLRKITLDNVWQIVKLHVADEQKNFVATNAESIIEAYANEKSGFVAEPFGIYDGDTPVGFLMVGYGGCDDEDEPSFSAGSYLLWRFMIDEKHQHKGFAKQAMKAFLEYVKAFPLGEATLCWTSYEPTNIVAKKFYMSFGFIPNGETIDDEEIAVLYL